MSVVRPTARCADSIMIHSTAKTHEEIDSFVKRFHAEIFVDKPIVGVLSNYAQVTEGELDRIGVIRQPASPRGRSSNEGLRRAHSRLPARTRGFFRVLHANKGDHSLI